MEAQSKSGHLLRSKFSLGDTTVEILQGNILRPGVDVEAVVTTDDNYLTMGSGVSRALADMAGPYYVRAAQAQCPVPVGSVVVTKPYRLPQHGLNVRRVLHGAVIDYDTAELPLEQVVDQLTANCLQTAEKEELTSLLFPAFATGEGKLAMEICAQHMGTAIKTYLARPRSLRRIYIILLLPERQADGSNDTVIRQMQERNQRFIRELNLVLGVPYNPAVGTCPSQDFFGRVEALAQLEAVLGDQVPDKRHAVILGGPRVGKWALLDRLYRRVHEADSPLNDKRCWVKVSFGGVHANTPTSFIYRKFLCALGATEENPDLIRALRTAYADTDMDCARFLQFLEDHEEHYGQVVFLIDHLPRLLEMEDGEARHGPQVLAFWRDLKQLEQRVRFVVTAQDDEQYRRLLDRMGEHFVQGVAVVAVACVRKRERLAWVDELYRRYLGRKTATGWEQTFIAEEAGQHPYLIALACHTLIETLKRDALTNPTHPAQYTEETLAPFLLTARNRLVELRRAFFDQLLGPALQADDRTELKRLAELARLEAEQRTLLADAGTGDPKALQQLARIEQTIADRQDSLHKDRLCRLQAQGYLVDAGSPQTAKFMAPAFAQYTAEFFSVAQDPATAEQRKDVMISLVRPDPASQMVDTLFRGRGARTVTSRKRLLTELKDEFLQDFGQFLNHLIYPRHYPPPAVFTSLEEVGNYILTQFATGAVKQNLQNPAPGSTVRFEVDESLQAIPWELMLETVYAGEIPFCVGRSIINARQPSNVNPPVRGNGKINTLLVGNPTGDLPAAQEEVTWLADQLRRDIRFEEPVLCIGPDACHRGKLLNVLQRGGFALIHFSGHTKFDGYQSAWQLPQGHDITTDMLTNALQMAPPAFVFSSSCQSGTGGEPQPLQFEDQTFDLPGAFLQAGVDAYVGTLWSIEDRAAHTMVKAFYDAFFAGQSLGECLRRAKWTCKQRGDRSNWPAFILYGDPHIEPGDLFPILGR